MKDFKRQYPLFSLCGLNCGLCPKYHTDGKSKCPGCGGQNFYSKHPSCSVVNCNKSHDNVEFCFECSNYPCEKYLITNEKDSFIYYKNVLSNFQKLMDSGIKQYSVELEEKISILEFLLDNYNDGRRKNFYCIAVNLLDLSDLREIINKINQSISKEDIDNKEKIKRVIEVFEKVADKRKLELQLRK